MPVLVKFGSIDQIVEQNIHTCMIDPRLLRDTAIFNTDPRLLRDSANSNNDPPLPEGASEDQEDVGPDPNSMSTAKDAESDKSDVLTGSTTTTTTDRISQAPPPFTDSTTPPAPQDPTPSPEDIAAPHISEFFETIEKLTNFRIFLNLAITIHVKAGGNKQATMDEINKINVHRRPHEKALRQLDASIVEILGKTAWDGIKAEGGSDVMALALGCKPGQKWHEKLERIRGRNELRRFRESLSGAFSSLVGDYENMGPSGGLNTDSGEDSDSSSDLSSIDENY